MKKIITLLVVLLLATSTKIFAQFPTIYASLTSGTWGTTGNLWETFTGNATNTPGAIGTGTVYASGTNPSGTHFVYIRSGHTITMGANKSCIGMTVESGATLLAGGSFRLQLATGGTGFTAPQNWSVTNNGTIGSASDGIYFEPGTNAGAITITGAGVYNIARIRMPGGLAGSGSGTVSVTIDANINFNIAANYALTAVYNPNVNDNYSININAGKTVTISSTGYFHNPATVAAVPGPPYDPPKAGIGGNYTYNINGTLDVSGSSGTSYICPLASAASVITMNVNGTVKLGTVFKTDTMYNSVGKVVLNINNGGVVDATATTTLSTAPPGATAPSNSGSHFNTIGTGVLKRSVGATDVNFAVGTSDNDYNLATLNNAGTLDNLTVAVKNTLDNAVPVASKIVNKQWTINEGTAGGTVGTIKLSWKIADQAASFNPAGVVVLASWNGTRYIGPVAVVTGSGTAADPYIATATGFIDFNRAFIVANLDALPLSLASIKAYQSGTGIKLDWATSTEINTDKFIVEKSTDGVSFNAIGTVAAKGNSNSLSNYTLFDAAPFVGNNYYRLKMLDKDGSYTYSAILKVAIGKIKTEVVIAPNPVKGNQLNIQFSNFERGTFSINVYNNAGQLVMNKTISHDGGSSSQVLQLPSQIKTGTYQVQITGNSTKVTKTIILE